MEIINEHIAHTRRELRYLQWDRLPEADKERINAEREERIRRVQERKLGGSCPSSVHRGAENGM